MRHLLSFGSLPKDGPVFIFGASTGGDVLRDGLARHTPIVLAGVIDDLCSGIIGGHWIISSAEFFAAPPAGAIILISSQHWRLIGRQLRAKGPVRLIDASPLIRRIQGRLLGGVVFDADDWLPYCPPSAGSGPETTPEAALEAATGLTLEPLIEALVPPSELPVERFLRRVRAVADRPEMPLYIYGTDERALDIYAILLCQPGVHVVGFIGEPHGFIDAIDRSPLEIFLSEEDDDPIIVIASPDGRAAIPRIIARGFHRIVDATPILAQAVPPAPMPLATRPDRSGSDRPLVSLVLFGPAAGSPPRVPDSLRNHDYPRLEGVVCEGDPTRGPALLDALRRCRGEIIGFCPMTAELLPGAVADAVAALDQRPEAVAVLDRSAAGFTMADALTGRPLPPLTAGFFRRPALDASGLLADPWSPECPAFEVWCRVAGDGDLARVDRDFVQSTGSPPVPETGPETLRPHSRVLVRLAAASGLFGHNGAILFDGLIRRFAAGFNAVLAAGGDPERLGVPLPRSRAGLTPIILPPVPVELYRTLARLCEKRGRIDQAVVGALPPEPHQGLGPWTQPRGDPLEPMTKAGPGRRATGDGRIHLGYLSARAERFGFLRRVMTHHDRARYRVFSYADRVTTDLLRAADVVRAVADLDETTVRRLIQSDGIDILVDAVGFGTDSPFCPLTRRYAPVQLGGFAHLGTSGGGPIDFVLTDGYSAPPTLDARFSEPLIRLSRPLFCFDETEDHFPPVRPPPCLTGNRITFGCFGPGSRINDRLIGWWAGILEQVPDSRLLLASASLEPVSGRTTLLMRFARHGIGPERLILRPGAGFRNSRLDYGDIDIALDTWPHAGRTSVVEALMNGVPVITLTGDTLAARCGAALLRTVGCDGFVAATPADYIAKAVALARDRPALVAHRATLRHAVWRSGLGDPAALAREVERACRLSLAGLPPQSRTAPASAPRFVIDCPDAGTADWIAAALNAHPLVFCAQLGHGLPPEPLRHRLDRAAALAAADSVACGVVGIGIAEAEAAGAGLRLCRVTRLIRDQPPDTGPEPSWPVFALEHLATDRNAFAAFFDWLTHSCVVSAKLPG